MNLTSLSCNNNFLINLDVTNNPKLEVLDCGYNQISNLDITKNVFLRSLDCQDNQMATLDVSSNNQLQELTCGGNQLSSLNLCNNGYIGHLSLGEMQSLDTVYVWSTFPEGVDHISNHPNARFVPCGGEQIVFLPDTAFLQALVEKGIDTNGDGLICFNEVGAITTLDISTEIDTVQMEHGLNCGPVGAIKTLIGIETFLNLDTLICF